jgi:hypothetical protein
MAAIEYKKSLEDEIDWKIIDQLHTATLNFSNTSLELKKLFIVLAGVAVPSLIKLAKDKLDTSLFVTIYLLAFTFWLLDSFTYFYQEGLREKMDSHFKKIKDRNKDVVVTEDNTGAAELTLEDSRKDNNRIIRSIFNLSVGLYMLAIFLNTFALVLYLCKIIK